MLKVYDIFKIVGDWCNERFGKNNVEAKTTGWAEEMESFNYHCLGNDIDCYVDIHGEMNKSHTAFLIWSHNKENINIRIFTNGVFKWEGETDHFEFCGAEEMRTLYDKLIQQPVSTKEHPLQNNSTIPEKDFVENQCVVIDDKPTVAVEDETRTENECSQLAHYIKITKIFDKTKLRLGAPYKIYNRTIDEYVYAILEKVEPDTLTFGWFYAKERKWNKCLVYLDDTTFEITPMFEEENDYGKCNK